MLNSYCVATMINVHTHMIDTVRCHNKKGRYYTRSDRQCQQRNGNYKEKNMAMEE